MTAPRPCSLCAHKERSAIDAALASGADELDVATRYVVTRHALKTHAPHIVAEKSHTPRSGPVSRRTAAQPSTPIQLEGETVPLRGVCAVCAHTDRAAIEVAAKNSIAIAARKHLVDPEVLRRHVREHVVRANEGEEPALDVDALVHARAALSRARKLRQEVYDNPEASVYDKQVASKHEHGAIKLLSDVEGARDLSETQILRSPAWARIEAALGQVLARHPDVAKELGDVLSELDCAPSAAEAA